MSLKVDQSVCQDGNGKVAFSDFMTEIVHDLPVDAMEFFRDKVAEIMPVLCLGNFKLKVVLDTNVLFQCVRGKMLEGSCFLDKVGNSPVLDLCAPPEIETEIYKKIEVKLLKEKKTKDLDIEQCKNTAKELLQMVRIERDPCAEYMLQASEIMNNRDSDDAPFLALYLSAEAHGILTDDKDLKDQENVRTFKLKDVGKVITVVNRGTLSLFVTCKTLPAAVKAIYEISCVILGAFIDFGMALSRAVATGIEKGFEWVRGWHPIAQIIASVGIIALEIKTGVLRKTAISTLNVIVEIINTSTFADKKSI